MSLCECMFLDFLASTTTALWGEGVCEKRQPFAEWQAEEKKKKKITFGPNKLWRLWPSAFVLARGHSRKAAVSANERICPRISKHTNL